MKRFAIYAAICFAVGIFGALVLSTISARQFDSSKLERVAFVPETEPSPVPTTKEEEEIKTESKDEAAQRPTSSPSGEACKINPDCDLVTEYCSKASCGDEFGICKKRPTSCANDFLVVCSCDGKTYSNECSALKNGSNVKGPGAC